MLAGGDRTDADLGWAPSGSKARQRSDGRPSGERSSTATVRRGAKCAKMRHLVVAGRTRCGSRSKAALLPSPGAIWVGLVGCGVGGSRRWWAAVMVGCGAGQTNGARRPVSGHGSPGRPTGAWGPLRHVHKSAAWVWAGATDGLQPMGRRRPGRLPTTSWRCDPVLGVVRPTRLPESARRGRHPDDLAGAAAPRSSDAVAIGGWLTTTARREAAGGSPEATGAPGGPDGEPEPRIWSRRLRRRSRGRAGRGRPPLGGRRGSTGCRFAGAMPAAAADRRVREPAGLP